MPLPLGEIDASTDEILAVYRAIARLDLRPYLHPAHAGELEQHVAAALREAIAAALERVSALQRLLDDEEVESGEWDAVMSTGVVDGTPTMAAALDGELWRHVGDVCFTVRGDLRRAERVLRPVAGASHEDRLAACESAQRKLRRTLAAVLTALGRARDRTVPAVDLAAEIETAAAVRRMYAKFRRSLPACDPADPASVRRALRYAAVSLAVMVGTDELSEARAQDRGVVMRLQARILRWARDGASDADGAQLYQDIVTAADLLRAINLRQELAARDQLMLREAARALAAGPPAAAFAAALPALRAVAGRDDALDALVEAALREPPTADQLAALRAALDPAGAPDAGAPGWSGGEESLG